MLNLTMFLTYWLDIRLDTKLCLKAFKSRYTAREGFRIFCEDLFAVLSIISWIFCSRADISDQFGLIQAHYFKAKAVIAAKDASTTTFDDTDKTNHGLSIHLESWVEFLNSIRRPGLYCGRCACVGTHGQLCLTDLDALTWSLSETINCRRSTTFVWKRDVLVHRSILWRLRCTW